MKMKYFIPILLILATIACKKDEIDLANFVVGEDNHSNLTKFEPPIYLYYGNRNCEFDIDLDGKIDIIFYYAYQSFPWGGANNSAGIEILNDKLSILIDSLGSIAIKDTTVICIDSVENSTCTDSLYFFKPTPKIFNLDDKVDDTQMWYDGKSLILSHLDDSKYYAMPQPVIRKSGIWNNVNEKYFVFRLIVDDITKYGWLKISLTESNEIIIHEYSF